MCKLKPLTPMPKPDTSADLFHEAALTARVLGSTRFKQVLSDARKLQEGDEKWYRKIIVKACSISFHVSQKEIFLGKSLGNRTDALRACYTIAKQLLKYSDQQVADLFSVEMGDKDRSLVSRYTTAVNKISRESKIKAQIDFLSKYDAAFSQVKQEIDKAKK